MSAKDVSEIKAQISDMRRELRNELHQSIQAINTMDERVRQLELDKARREGKESVVTTGDLSWRKATLSVLGILSTATTAALVIAQAVLR